MLELTWIGKLTTTKNKFNVPKHLVIKWLNLENQKSLFERKQTQSDISVESNHSSMISDKDSISANSENKDSNVLKQSLLTVGMSFKIFKAKICLGPYCLRKSKFKHKVVEDPDKSDSEPSVSSVAQVEPLKLLEIKENEIEKRIDALHSDHSNNQSINKEDANEKNLNIEAFNDVKEQNKDIPKSIMLFTPEGCANAESAQSLIRNQPNMIIKKNQIKKQRKLIGTKVRSNITKFTRKSNNLAKSLPRSSNKDKR